MKSAIKDCTCGARFIFLRHGDGWRPVNLETTKPSDTTYDPSKGHVSHFQTCPDRKQYQRKPDGERPAVYDDRDLADYHLQRRAPAPGHPGPPVAPEGAGPQLQALYASAGELGFNHREARALLDHAGITGNPLTWDAATIARAGEVLARQATLRDQWIAQVQRAALEFQQERHERSIA